MPKFSDLAFKAMDAYTLVAAAEYALERAREDAVKSAAAVVAALKLTPRGKAALVDADGDVLVHSLTADRADCRVETIVGDFDVDGDGTGGAVERDPAPDFDPALDAFAEFAVS